MKSLQILSVVSGLMFGVWPIVMSYSRLSGNITSIVLAAITIICVTPFSVQKFGTLAQANWWLASLAGILGAIGITCFNTMLAKAPKTDLPTFFILMVLVQVACPVVYQLATSGGMTTTKGCGFALAGIAAILLIKG